MKTLTLFVLLLVTTLTGFAQDSPKEKLFVPWGIQPADDGQFIPQTSPFLQQQTGCLAQGYTNGCAGPGLRFLYTGSGTIDHWEIQRRADNRVFILPGNPVSFLDKIGCDWSSTYTYTSVTTTGARCSVTTSGNPPHSSCYNSQGVEICPPVLRLDIQSAASFQDLLTAQGAIVAGYTTNLPNAQATSLPLPTELAGVRVLVEGRPAEIFGIFNGNQINFRVPPTLPDEGYYGVEIQRPDGSAAWGRLYSRRTWTSLFSANSTGQGIAAGYWLNGQTGRTGLLSTPVDRTGNAGYLVLFTTGLNVTSNVTVNINRVEVNASFAGQAGFVGQQQVNVNVPSGLPSGVQLPVFVCGGGSCSQLLYVQF